MSGCFPISLYKRVMYKENRMVPRTWPCGTPNSSSSNVEKVDPNLIAWNQWPRQDVNHFKPMLHTPNYDVRQLRRVVWSIVSSAADRSSKTSAVGSSHDSVR